MYRLLPISINTHFSVMFSADTRVCLEEVYDTRVPVCGPNWGSGAVANFLMTA